MLNTLFPATPAPVRQAPNHRALEKTTTLILESLVLATPPIAQEYFDPGVNTARRRRAKPKADYSLPSDMREYPLGFVPTNQTPGANGEEPSIIKVPESVPADLLQVFARIAAEEKIAAAMPKYAVDTGSVLMGEFQETMNALQAERKAESMREKGFTPQETEMAMGTVRMEKALQVAREAPAAVPIKTVLEETFRADREMEVQTGEEKPSRTKKKTVKEMMEEAKQPPITEYFPSKK